MYEHVNLELPHCVFLVFHCDMHSGSQSLTATISVALLFKIHSRRYRCRDKMKCLRARQAFTIVISVISARYADVKGKVADTLRYNMPPPSVCTLQLSITPGYHVIGRADAGPTKAATRASSSAFGRDKL